MRGLGIGVLLAFGLGSAAHAQSTQCIPTGNGGMQCQTTPDAAQNLRNLQESEGVSQGSARRVPRDLPNDGDPVFPAMCSGFYYAELSCMAQVNAERKEVGALMANGQCDDAMKRALREADYKMAATVKSLCVASH